jgi:tetratricopeptide (TPR) repeat protein
MSLTSCVLALSLAFSVVPASAAQGPNAFATLSAKADAARDANRLDEAVTLYRKALALRPRWQDGWWSLGTILYDSDSYKTAAPAFRRLIAIDPKNGTAHLMLGLCEYQLRLYADSMNHIHSAKRLGIKKDEQLEHVLLYHEGMLWLQAGSYENAIEPLGTLVKQGVRSEELDLAVGLAVLMMPPNDVLEASPRREMVQKAGRAEEYNLAKNVDEARKAYDALVREASDFPNIHYAYARFLLSIEEVEEARSQLQEEIKRSPGHIRARMQLATTYYRSNSAEGIPYVQEVVKLKPDYPFGHYLLGLLYFDAGDLSKSMPQLEAAVRMVPQEPQFQFALGNAYAKAGRKVDAAKARAAFRSLGGDAESSAGSDTYGNERSIKLNRVPVPPAENREDH